MKINYRIFLTVCWVLAYIVVIICYLTRVNGPENPYVNTFERIITLFGIVSAILIPQIALMFSFFFELAEAQINSIIENKPHARLAYWFSLTYIVIFTLVVVCCIGLKKPFNWPIGTATNYIVITMGHIGVLATLPLRYLFK